MKFLIIAGILISHSAFAIRFDEVEPGSPHNVVPADTYDPKFVHAVCEVIRQTGVITMNPGEERVGKLEVIRLCSTADQTPRLTRFAMRGCDRGFIFRGLLTKVSRAYGRDIDCEIVSCRHLLAKMKQCEEGDQRILAGVDARDYNGWCSIYSIPAD